jgi:hypothetical protein
MDDVRDRIVSLERVEAAELLGHDENFRVHPQAQKNAFKGILDEIGQAGALIGYHSERNGGKLTLIDGHMRAKDFGGTWPVLVTDLDDDEADMLLQAYDPVGSLAMVDKDMLANLREKQEFDDASVRIMLDGLNGIEGGKTNPRDSQGNTNLNAEKAEDKSIVEMELQPYEHYDYIMVVCKTTFDWNWLTDRFGIVKKDGSNDHRVTKIGLGRCITGSEVIRAMKAYEDEIAAVKQFIADSEDIPEDSKSRIISEMEQARLGTEQY